MGQRRCRLNAAELRAKALQAQDLDQETVPVPEWDCTFVIRQMPEEKRVAFDLWHGERLDAGAVDLSEWCCRLVSECTFDETGERVFSESDIGALKQKSRFAISRLVDSAVRVNRIGDKSREDAEKNSEAHASGSNTA